MPETPTPLRQLRRRREFLHVAQRGDRRAAPGLVLQACPRPAAADIGLGLTASKKVGNAVVRNRIKRRFRELLRAELPEAGLPDHDHVLIARDAAIERDFGKLREELAEALSRASAGKGDPPRKPRERRRPPRGNRK